MDIRTVILILIVGVLVIYYLGFSVFWWLALAGVLIALGALIYTILRGSGKLIIFRRWMKRVGMKLKKFESKFFKWLD